MMERINENGSITFFPETVEEEQNVHSLSTTGRLLAYNDELKKNLKNGIKFTDILDKLIETDDPYELLDAVTALSTYQLNSSYLVFPQQYSQSDYYLIFLNRLLQLHENEKVVIQSSDRNDELYHEFPGINHQGYFVFRLEDGFEGGAYYTEKKTGEVLFYINFNQKLLHFNSSAITNLLVVKYGAMFNYKVVKELESYLVDLGNYFKEDFGFDVDFNIMDASNNAYYKFTKQEIPQDALDKLFIAASKENFMLVTDLNDDAILKLDNNVELIITDRPVEQEKSGFNWGMSIQDQNEKVAWFDLLFKYSFLKDWYLNNLKELEIESNQLYF